MKKKKGRAKAKGKGKPKRTSVEKIEIVLDQDGGATPAEPLIKAGDATKVRWVNEADRGLTVEFQYWPFVEAKVPIAVESGKKSKWYNVYNGVIVGKSYTYTIEPDLASVGDPPDPPGLVVGP